MTNHALQWLTFENVKTSSLKVKRSLSLYFLKGNLSDNTNLESIEAVLREFELFNYITFPSTWFVIFPLLVVQLPQCTTVLLDWYFK